MIGGTEGGSSDSSLRLTPQYTCEQNSDYRQIIHIVFASKFQVLDDKPPAQTPDPKP